MNDRAFREQVALENAADISARVRELEQLMTQRSDDLTSVQSGASPDTQGGGTQDMDARLDFALAAARRIVAMTPYCYDGDPDLMTEEEVEASMKRQDEERVIREFRRIVGSYWR